MFYPPAAPAAALAAGAAPAVAVAARHARSSGSPAKGAGAAVLLKKELCCLACDEVMARARRGINRPGRRSGGRQTAAGGLKEWTRASQGPPRHHHCLFILQMKVTAEDGIDAVILI